MTKVRTFSRVFPSYHPRAGEPTYFVEKIWNSIAYMDGIYAQQFPIPYKELGLDFQKITDQKHHTIRAGHHFKPGDWFSPRVWSGVPYKSKQIIIAPDIQVKKVWDFSVSVMSDKSRFSMPNIDEVAQNDGLELIDFMQWFNKPFDGQIICWNEKVNY